jgi:hypothetical protein
MPIHDWSRVPSGLFHHFHQDWSIEIARALNRSGLPKGLSAMVEQRAGAVEGDVLAIESHRRAKRADPSRGGGPFDDGGLITLAPPATSIVRRTTREIYADRSNRVVVKHHLGRIVAVIEILSPDNKDSRSALGDFVDKTLAFLRRGVHLLLVDLFPPSPRDPFGMHKRIWDEIADEPFAFPPGKDRILASYEIAPERAAYVEPVAVGDPLPAMPLFLWPGTHVRVPLEPTYRATWDASPEEMRTAVETGVMPDPDAEE